MGDMAGETEGEQAMSRSGYVDDLDPTDLILYRGRVERALRGKRGQYFLRELLTALDAMPEKELIADELVREDGACCAIGVVCKARNLDVRDIDYHDPEAVGRAVNIARSMAAEIEYENDEGTYREETPSERWHRMRNWTARHLRT